MSEKSPEQDDAPDSSLWNAERRRKLRRAVPYAGAIFGLYCAILITTGIKPKLNEILEVLGVMQDNKGDKKPPNDTATMLQMLLDRVAIATNTTQCPPAPPKCKDAMTQMLIDRSNLMRQLGNFPRGQGVYYKKGIPRIGVACDFGDTEPMAKNLAVTRARNMLMAALREKRYTATKLQLPPPISISRKAGSMTCARANAVRVRKIRSGRRKR